MSGTGQTVEDIVIGLKGAWSLFCIECALYIVIVTLLSAPVFIQVYRHLSSRYFGKAERFLSAFLAGQFCGTLACVYLIKLLGFKPFLLLGIYAGAALLSYFGTTGLHAFSGRKWPTFSTKTVICFLVFLGLVLIGTMLPFSRIAEQTELGYAVRAYFSADFLKHVSVTAELSKGDVPPVNPFCAGETLHYYWLSYIPSAMVYRLLGPDYSLVRITIAFSLFVNVFLLLTIFTLFRHYVTDLIGRIVGLATLLFVNSYEGGLILYRIWRQAGEILQIRNYNIDALTRWDFGHPQIDSLFRSFLYTPQQQLALSSLCLLFLLLREDRWPVQIKHATRLTVSFLIALLGAAVLGYNFFTGAVVVPWLGICLGIAWLFYRRLSYLDLSLITLILVGSIGSYYLFDMFPSKGNVFSLMIDKTYILGLHRIVLYNFGPLVILGIPGMLSCCRKSSRGSGWLNILLFTLFATFCMLFIRIQDFPSDVSLKTGLLVALGLSLFTGQTASFLIRKWGGYGYLVLLLLLIPAGPHWIIDVFNTQDIDNNRFTVYFQKEDLTAARWLARNTPLDYCVQALPERDIHCSDLITVFAERRTGLADSMHAQIYLIDQHKYKTRQRDILQLFHGIDLTETQDLCHKIGIDAVFIGNAERNLNSAGIDKFSLCKSIYTHAPVEIVALKPKAPLIETMQMPEDQSFFLAEVIYQLVDQIEIDFGTNVARAWFWGDFSGPETTHSTSFRWLQHGDAFLICPPFDEQSWLMTMRIQPFYAPNLQNQSLSLFWSDFNHKDSGISLPNKELVTFELKPGWQEYTCELSAHEKLNGPEVLVMEPLKSGVPAQLIQGSSDTRTLSVAFDYVRFDRMNGKRKQAKYPDGTETGARVLAAPYPDHTLVWSAPGIAAFSLMTPPPRFSIKGKLILRGPDQSRSHLSLFIRSVSGTILRTHLVRTVGVEKDSEMSFSIEVTCQPISDTIECYFIVSSVPENSLLYLENCIIASSGREGPGL
ncbi:hypothetical protein JXQ70_10740 [bacterium]|nr:hypothetical protein [bacterium]